MDLGKGKKRGTKALESKAPNEPGSTRATLLHSLERGFSFLTRTACTLFPDPVKMLFCTVGVHFPTRVEPLHVHSPSPSGPVAGVRRGGAGLRLTRGEKAPTPPLGVGGDVQSWPSPKGASLSSQGKPSPRPARPSPSLWGQSPGRGGEEV